MKVKKVNLKDGDVKVYTPKESFWKTVVVNAEAKEKTYENELMFTRAVIEMAKNKVKMESEKNGK